MILDGSIAILRALEVILAGLDWEVRTTAFAGNALAEVLRKPTALLITGLRPSRGCGLRLIETLRHRGWTGRVVILTARPECVAASVLRALDIAAVLNKPFKLESLRAAVEQGVWGGERT